MVGALCSFAASKAKKRDRNCKERPVNFTEDILNSNTVFLEHLEIAEE
jgi:hypothetical protein